MKTIKMYPLDSYMFETYEVKQAREKPVFIKEFRESKKSREILISMRVSGETLTVSRNQFQMLKKAMEMYSRSQGGIG